MKINRLSVAAAAAALLLCGCDTSPGWEETLALAGRARITRLDLTAFNAVARFTPSTGDSPRLLTMAPVSGLIETEAIFRAARWTPSAVALLFAGQWRWKKRCLIARMYALDILQKNCGRTDAEVLDYYNTNRDTFAIENTSAKPAKRIIPPFDSIRFGVVRKLFLRDCAADSSFADLRNPANFRQFIFESYPEFFYGNSTGKSTA